MKNTLIIILCCISLIASAEEKKVYKNVDEHGNVTFSDVPVKDAEEVKVHPTPTFKVPNYSSMMPKESKVAKDVSYDKLLITSPKHDQVFWNVEGNEIAVTTRIEPKLQAGHKIVIKLDGKGIAGNVLTNLYRGSYVLTAEVQGVDGEPLITSAPVSIHIKRHIIKKKPKPADGITTN